MSETYSIIDYKLAIKLQFGTVCMISWTSTVASHSSKTLNNKFFMFFLNDDLCRLRMVGGMLFFNRAPSPQKEFCWIFSPEYSK